MGLVSDVLLGVGLAFSWAGVGIPVAAAGGGLRALRGGRAAANLAKASKHSGKFYMAMTGAELGSMIQRSLFDKDLTHVHTF